MVESVISDRFGRESLRIFRFLLAKHHLEEKQVFFCCGVRKRGGKEGREKEKKRR